MTRHYLHLRDGTEELLDPDGSDCSAEDVIAYALASARDLMAGELKSRGILDLRWRIEVEDEAGHIVNIVRFADAVEILTASA